MRRREFITLSAVRLLRGRWRIVPLGLPVY
jgi:hypothetical protein